MTIETKGARNGSLIVKVNGKRAKFYEAASLIGNLRNPNLEIRTDRNVTYTQTCTEKCHAVYFKDSTGNLYKFDYFFSETTLRNIATGNLHNNLYKTAAELYKTDAEREEILSTPLVTIEAQDAAIDAEIELATDYQPQTNWENPHDFTIVGDLSDRNINGRIAAFNHKEEVTLTDNMKLAKQITDKLGSLLVKFSGGEYGTRKGAVLHYETFKDEHDEFGTLTRVVEVFTDQTNFILDHVNFITGYGDDKKVEQFFFKRDDFSDFEQHLLALQKEQEDAYPEEVKALNRDLAQSNLTAPNMHLHIYNNDFHIGSFCGVELSKLHVKSFVTDKIHFNVCYASEPLEHYDTFEEVTAAVNQFKDAISRGDKEFTFPTADKLNQPVPATPAKHQHTFEVGANYFSRDFNQCAYTILKRSKKMLTVVFKGFENYDDCIVRVKIRHDENGEYFTVKEEVGVNVSCAINVYSSDFQALLIQPTRKQIVESLNRAIDKAKFNVQIARVSGNQVQANFERELYLIAAKALHELKH